MILGLQHDETSSDTGTWSCRRSAATVHQQGLPLGSNSCLPDVERDEVVRISSYWGICMYCVGLLPGAACGISFSNWIFTAACILSRQLTTSQVYETWQLPSNRHGIMKICRSGPRQILIAASASPDTGRNHHIPLHHSTVLPRCSLNT